MQGKILRDTSNGEGIIFIDGEQKTFTLEKYCKSGELPKVGATVEVLLDANKNIESVILIDHDKKLSQTHKEMSNIIGDGGKNLLLNILNTMGRPVLICLAIILLSSIVFDFFSVSVSVLGMSESHGAALLDVLDFLQNPFYAKIPQ